MQCHHGLHHHAHHHHHDGLAEGMSNNHLFRLRLVMLLSACYMVAQFLGGYFSHSLALLAEAGHKLGDTCIIGMALGAAWFAAWPANNKKTFGYGRMEILVAMSNAMLLVLVATGILAEAWERLINHSFEIEGGLMLLVSLVGMGINFASAAILKPGVETNLNIRSTYLHVRADLLSSLATLVSAILIMMFQTFWLDTVLSVFIASMVMMNAIRILKEAIHILMESAPSHISVEAIEKALTAHPGVASVHDMHVWTITTGKNAILTHVMVESAHFKPETVSSLEHLLRSQYDLCHITVQLEPVGFEESAIPF